jgi:hypothetical protein
MFFFNVLITTAMFLDRYKSQVVGGHKCETRIPVVFNYSYVGIECYIIRGRLLRRIFWYFRFRLENNCYFSTRPSVVSDIYWVGILFSSKGTADL